MKKYVKPTIKKVKGLDFVLVGIKSGSTVVCRQCSSCHGCR